MSAVTPQRTPHRTPLGPVAAARLVAEREVSVKLRDKAFLVSTAVTLLIVLASVFVPAVLSGRSDTERVAAVGTGAPAALRSAAATTDGDLVVDVVAVPDAQAATRMVRSGDVDAALVPEAGGTYRLVGDTSTSGALLTALSTTLGEQRQAALLTDLGADATQRRDAARPAVTQQLLDPDSDETQIIVVSIVFALLFFMTVYTYGFGIAQSVVEKKSSRVVELLVAAVPVRSLLLGKVAGNTLMALGQLVLLLSAGLVGLAATGEGALIRTVATASGWFVLFFLLGFTMLAALWAAAGALAARVEDLQSTTLPLQMLVMGPFFLAIYVTDPGRWLTLLSYVPFTAPLSMPRRLLSGDAAWWEAVASAGIIAATTALIVVVAARLYRGSLLRTGAKSSIAQAWQGARA